mmetsp:Transcript_26805/g.38288  ORF Transcript_26805/g.38288 Transcript_26805/m.38288 type:complete len:589 (-) Transcript_26805:52-1818(-)
MNEEINLIEIIELTGKSEEQQSIFGETVLLKDLLPLLNNYSKICADSWVEGNETEEWLQSITKLKLVLHSIILLCRRQILEKKTVSIANLDRLNDSLPLIFETALSSAVVTSENNLSYCFCVLVMVLASDSDFRQHKLSDIGVHKTIMEIISKYPHDYTVCEMALRAIRNLSANDEVACVLANSGVCETLVAVLEGIKLHAGESVFPSKGATSLVPGASIGAVETLEAAYWAIGNMSFDADISAVLGSLGLCRGLVDSFLAALGPLAFEEGVPVLDIPLLKSQGRLGVLSSLASAIRNLSFVGVNRDGFEATSACALLAGLVEGLHRAQSEDEAVEGRGAERDALCSCLWSVVNLSCSGPCAERLASTAPLLVRTLRLQQRLLAPEALDMVLGPLAEAGLFAIRNLVTNSPDLAPALAEAPDFVAAMLTRYRDREGMVEASCAALSALAVAREHRTAMATRLDVFARLFAASAMHAQVAETVEACLRTALALLDTLQPECVAAFSPHLLQTVQCLEGHPHAPEVLRLACQLLLVLPDREDWLQRLKELGQIQESPQGGWLATPTGSFEDILTAWDIQNLKTNGLPSIN